MDRKNHQQPKANTGTNAVAVHTQNSEARHGNQKKKTAFALAIACAAGFSGNLFAQDLCGSRTPRQCMDLLLQKLGEQNETIKSLKAQLTTTNAQVANVGSSLTTVQNDVRALSSKVGDADLAAKRAQDTADGAANQIVATKGAVDALTTDLNTTKTNVNSKINCGALISLTAATRAMIGRPSVKYAAVKFDVPANDLKTVRAEGTVQAPKVDGAQSFAIDCVPWIIHRPLPDGGVIRPVEPDFQEDDAELSE